MTSIRTFPPLDELLPGQLADFYEVIRDGEPVMVARDDLTYDERTDIADKLRSEGEAAVKYAEEAQRIAARDAEAARIHGEWTTRELAKGRPAAELTWGNCVRELGLLSQFGPSLEWPNTIH